MAFLKAIAAELAPKLSLRTVLVIPFVLQIFAAVGLTGYVSFRNGQEAVNSLAIKLQDEVSIRIRQHLDSYLETPHLINQINANAVHLRQLDLQDFPGLQSHFWQQIQLFKSVSYIQYASPFGDFVGAARLGGQTSPIEVEITKPDKGTGLYRYATNHHGELTELLGVTPDYDPRKESDWYAEAVNSKTETWSSIYQYEGLPIVAITAGYPLFDKAGEFQGVVATDLILSDISSFLRKLKIGKSGKTFIIERSGLLVASSTKAEPFVVNANGEAERQNGETSNDPLIRQVTAYLKIRYGNFSLINDSIALKVKINGKPQFLQVFPFQDKRGLNWLIAIAVPEADFMEQINANTRTTILLCLLALAVATLVGLMTSRWIVEPIWRLSKASQAIAEGYLDQKLPVKGIHELRILAKAFNQMATQLQSSFAALAVANEELEIRVEERTAQIRENRAELVALFRSMDDTILVIDETGFIRKIAPTRCDWLFHDPAAQINQSVYDVFPLAVAQLQVRLTQQAITHQQSIDNVEYQIALKGEEKWLLASVSPLNEKSAIWVSRDITERKQAEQAIEKRDRYLVALVEVQRLLLLAAIDVQVYNQILNILGAVSEASRIYIFENHHDLNNRLVMDQVAEWCATGITSEMTNPETHNLSYEEFFPGWLEILSQDRIISSRVQDFPVAIREILEPQDIKAVLIIPLTVNSEFFGFIGFDNCREERAWSDLEVGILSSAAAAIANALERQFAKDHLNSQLRRSVLLQRLTEEIHKSLDVQQVFQTASVQIGRVFGASRCLIHTYIAEPVPQLPSVAEYLEPGINAVLGYDIPIMGNPYAEQLLIQDSAIASDEIAVDPLLAPTLILCQKAQIRSLLAVRTSYQGEPNGAISLHQCDHLRHWNLEEIALLEAAAAQVGIAIAQAQLLKQETQRRSELAQKNTALEQAKLAAEAANVAKTRFLSHMSHELRTPLNAILGFTQLMANHSSLSKQDRDYLSIINRSGEHLLTLINDILSMSKIEAGQLTLSENSFDLHYLLNSLQDLLRLKANSKGIDLNFESTADLPQFVKTDESKLRQVLMNLLGNAIKFTAKGSVTLRVDSKQYFSESRLILSFAVEDTGAGISPEEISQLFNPFVQTSSGRQSMQGTGLGLSISRQFVQLMGGDIQVYSQLNQGTIFSFEIEVKPVQSISVPPSQAHLKIIALQPNQPQYRILVVEDIPENRKLLVDLLTPLGFNIREAVNGQEAIAVWEEWHPHLIWMDMQMPVMDGYQATKKIRDREQQIAVEKIPIIALTASAFEEERATIFASGCDDCVGKPIQESVLFDKIADYLGVRYVYAEAVPQTPTELPATQRSLEQLKADLAQLPTSWLQELHQGARCADEEIVLQILAQLPAEYAELKEAIADLVQDFRFETILQLAETFVA